MWLYLYSQGYAGRHEVDAEQLPRRGERGAELLWLL